MPQDAYVKFGLANQLEMGLMMVREQHPCGGGLGLDC